MNQLTMEEIKVLNEKQKYQNRHFKVHYKGKFWAYRRLSFYCGSTDITFFHEMNINPANPKMEIETVWSYPKDMVLRHCMLL